MKNYSDAIALIEKWEADCIELRKIEDQDLTDKTKRMVLKKMMPIELQKDIERGCTLLIYSQVYTSVIQQIPLRRDRQQAGSGKKGKNDDQEVDELDENVEEKKEDEEDEHTLDTMKGSGKGLFQGNCTHCGKWGHRKSDCWKLTQEMQGKGGNNSDKGKGKGGKDGGKDAWGKGGSGYPARDFGWQTKGKGGFGKGYGKNNGGKRVWTRFSIQY